MNFSDSRHSTSKMNCFLVFMVYGNTAPPRLGEPWHHLLNTLLPCFVLFCLHYCCRIRLLPFLPVNLHRTAAAGNKPSPFSAESSANSLHHFQRISIQSISCLITCVQTHGAKQTLESSTCWLVLCLTSLLRCERGRTSCLTMQRWRCWQERLVQFVRLFKVKTSPKND